MIKNNLPKGWEYAKVGDNKYTKLILGQSPESEFYNSEQKGLPFFQGKSDFGTISPTATVWCNKPKKIAEANDVLLCVRAPVGPTNLANQTCCIGRGLAAIRCLNGLDYRYLICVLKKFEKEIASGGQGSTFDAIGKDEINKIEFPFPLDKKEQLKIASSIDFKLTAIEQMRQAALQQKEAVDAMQGALLREVFPYKAGDELPKGWKWEKIDNVAKVGKTRKKKVASSPKEQTSFVPMDSVNEFTGSITKVLFRPYDELGQSYTYFENGDIIFAKITPCMQNGKCAIVSDMKDGFGYGSSEYVVLTPTKPVYTKWVHYFLRTVEFRRAAEEHFTGSAGQQRVPTDYIQKYPIPVPEDEKLIEKLTSKLDKKHEEYFKILKQSETQLEAIEAMPAAILREVFDFNTNKN
jgi:type I restriction enzyme S subunit